ncbi:MAG TPA: SIMPL domain-containing protein [Pyrinomonadaceae bacterium]|nr:SIMPL domain-containing protein [Pyrinomonadaceae bacterium]
MRHRLRQVSRLLLACLCLALPCLAQTAREQSLITVTGDAEVRVVPDEVVFDVTVRTFNRELKAAKSQTDERVKALIDLTRRYKVAPEDVQTDYVRLEPRYRGDNDARTLLGYSVRKDLVFTLRDVTQAESLLSEVMTSGVTNVNSINFRTSQLRKHRDQARALAIRAAREKAVALTAEIGQKIGKAFSIEEEVPGGIANFRGGLMNQNALAVDGASGSESAEGTLALGQIKVNARVTVRFILE